MPIYDAIVIGVGGMGSAALYHLARRGLRVLGLEQYNLAHDRGSSHGETRLIRRAYFEHPAYVPLIDRSYALWEELERETSHRLLHRCGLLLGGDAKKSVITGVRRTIEAHDLKIERVPRDDWASRFPAFRPDDHMEVLYESDAGILEVECCVRAHLEAATRRGATVFANQAVLDWSCDDTSVSVTTASAKHVADRLVICGGPWSAMLLDSLNLPLAIRRKSIVWFENADPLYRRESGCPVFLFETPDACLYGFPQIGPDGVKVADHAGDERVTDPSLVDRTVHPREDEKFRTLTRRYLPCLGSTITRRSVCMYTMTPDEHFIVDRHPRHPRVAFACGFSGHGFKFAPIIGSVLADLTTTGTTREPVAFLRADRLHPPFPRGDTGGSSFVSTN